MYISVRIVILPTKIQHFPFALVEKCYAEQSTAGKFMNLNYENSKILKKSYTE